MTCMCLSRPYRACLHLQVHLVEGAINGIRVRFIDTPGLVPAASAVGYNAKVLGQIKKAHKKYKPDNVLYFDRMDTVSFFVCCFTYISLFYVQKRVICPAQRIYDATPGLKNPELHPPILCR